MNRYEIKIEEQISDLYPDFLEEEIADIITRMAIYNETILEAVNSLRKNGVIL